MSSLKIGCQSINDSEAEDHNNDEREAIEDELVYAAVDYNPTGSAGDRQLAFQRGDAIRVKDKTTSDWWWAELGGKEGYIPVNSLSGHQDREDPFQDQEYFDSYAFLKLHLEMLQDKARTLAYKQAIEINQEGLQDKVCLDVGSGTGILSLFCAKLGKAKKVYAVEASNFVQHAKQIIKENHLEDIVTVIEGKIENVTLPEKVDVIVSEWMGTLLLFEYMIETVLLARDKWLVEGGIMWPSMASLYLVPCTATTEYKKTVQYWDSVYGFDFSSLKPVAMQEFHSKPIYNHALKPDDCLAMPADLISLDMNKITIEDIEEFKCNFHYYAIKSGTMHGFGSWFTVDFQNFNSKQEKIVLNTGPWHKETHWKQDLLMMDQPVEVCEGDVIEGYMTISRNPHWRRHLSLLLRYNLISVEGQRAQTFAKEFFLWK